MGKQAELTTSEFSGPGRWLRDEDACCTSKCRCPGPYKIAGVTAVACHSSTGGVETLSSGELAGCHDNQTAQPKWVTPGSVRDSISKKKSAREDVYKFRDTMLHQIGKLNYLKEVMLIHHPN